MNGPWEATKTAAFVILASLYSACQATVLGGVTHVPALPGMTTAIQDQHQSSVGHHPGSLPPGRWAIQAVIWRLPGGRELSKQYRTIQLWEGTKLFMTRESTQHICVPEQKGPPETSLRSELSQLARGL